uniref:Uncharacterized protein n=1 Tax=Megaselia scalaris TaxID=36166 RepID=T1GMK7_MEGSC
MLKELRDRDRHHLFIARYSAFQFGVSYAFRKSPINCNTGFPRTSLFFGNASFVDFVCKRSPLRTANSVGFNPVVGDDINSLTVASLVLNHARIYEHCKYA